MFYNPLLGGATRVGLTVGSSLLGSAAAAAASRNRQALAVEHANGSAKWVAW